VSVLPNMHGPSTKMAKLNLPCSTESHQKDCR